MSDTFLLIRSARRTLALEIKPDATLVVRAPRRTPLGQIQKFVASHDDWINRKQAAAINRPRAPEKRFVEGEEFLLQGKACRLRLIDNPAKAVDFDGRLLLSMHAQPRAREAIIKRYRSRAREILTGRVEKFAAVMGCRPASIRITSPQRRWGSCGVNDTLNFNWRLVMAPPEIIDYVVIHELAHIRYKGHGRDFWGMVEAFEPAYRQARRWLRESGHTLDF